MGIEFTVFKGSSDGIVQATSYRNSPTGNQVLVKITHSGICGTDEHFKHADMVLGHEGVGTVVQLGERVEDFEVGDVVGWGYVYKTCGACTLCLTGRDQYCPTAEQYGLSDLDQGSFATHAVWDASRLFKIPKGYAPENAAPLMCGGATVFTVCDSYIRPTDRVGVVGVGGLGHLAIQFLAKMGVHVVAFSNTGEKRADSLRFGAAEFYETKGVSKFELPTPLDHLLVTSSFLPDWTIFLNIMRSTGRIYPLTISESELIIPSQPVAVRGLVIQGSAVASRATQVKMLDFAAFHNIKPVIECFPMTKAGVEEGMAKLREGRMRYKAVLVAWE
ncbi:putative NADP-dependent alcohol dehydrogenase C 2 [Mycena galericulata]|nr:putative NADP-dependent alcohol dehydrogenase C 2 [Mycena galericulata]